MSDALRDLLEQHAHDVDDVAAGDRLAQVHGRVTSARRRRRAGGSVLAAVVVAALAVGLTVFTGDQRDQRPGPAKPSMEGYLSMGFETSGQGLESAQLYLEAEPGMAGAPRPGVPENGMRLVFSCPLGGGGGAELTLTVEDGPDKGSSESIWKGPCGPEEQVIDLPGPGIELPNGTTFPPGTFASVTMRQSAGNGEELETRFKKVRIEAFEKLDPRVRTAAGQRIDEVFADGHEDTWELVRVVESDKGADRLEAVVDEDRRTLVMLLAGYDGTATETSVDGASLGEAEFPAGYATEVTIVPAGEQQTIETRILDGRRDDGQIAYVFYSPSNP